MKKLQEGEEEEVYKGERGEEKEDLRKDSEQKQLRKEKEEKKQEEERQEG